jgi:hypothetical protein
MPLSVKWTATGPVVSKSNSCESCGQPFACELSLTGCWCSKVDLSADARQELRTKYRRCLCPACLVQYATTGRPDSP